MYRKLSYFFMTLILMTASSPSLSQVSITAEERDALIALYEATDGASWKQNTGWLGEEGTECEWFGIDCSESRHGKRIMIALAHNGLKGFIPAEISQISTIRSLDLSNNQLTGSIPAEIGLISSLGNLNLSHNQLSGAIPDELCDVSLRNLRLDNNQFSG
ncbi:MAG: hypothetical protein KAJ63_03880, partial [Methyloprofundus sp.]|nr:hypothetical protein [Methyloprofundus sp.]